MIAYSIVHSPKNKKRGSFDWMHQLPNSHNMSWLMKSQALQLSLSKLEAEELLLVQEINTKMNHINAVKALIEKDTAELVRVRGEIASKKQLITRRTPANSHLPPRNAQCGRRTRTLLAIYKNCAWRNCGCCHQWLCGPCLRAHVYARQQQRRYHANQITAEEEIDVVN